MWFFGWLFLVIGNSGTGGREACADSFCWVILLALNSHLQCYRLRCFSSARPKYPLHPLPVKRRPFGRTFRILRFGPLEAKTRKMRFVSLRRVNGRGRFGGQTARGHPKASPQPRQPLFSVPALRELESACRASILWDAVTVPAVCFSGALRGSPEGVSSSLRLSCHRKSKKIPTPIKAKLAPPPPSKKPMTSPLKPGILWAWGFSSRKNQKMPGAHKIGTAISGPRITGGKITDMRLFPKTK